MDEPSREGDEVLVSKSTTDFELFGWPAMLANAAKCAN